MKFTIWRKAISINEYHKSTASGRRYITKSGREFTNFIIKSIKHRRKELQEYFRNLEPDEMVQVYITHYQTNFYKKDGTFNQRCIDADNPAKIIVDTFMKVAKFDDYIIERVSCGKAYRPTKDIFKVEFSKVKVFKDGTQELQNDEDKQSTQV